MHSAAGSYGKHAEDFVLQLFRADLAVPTVGLHLRYAVQEGGAAQLAVQLRLSCGRSVPLRGVSQWSLLHPMQLACVPGMHAAM